MYPRLGTPVIDQQLKDLEKLAGALGKRFNWWSQNLGTVYPGVKFQLKLALPIFTRNLPAA